MLKTFDVVPCSRIFFTFLFVVVAQHFTHCTEFLLDLFYNFFQLGFFCFLLDFFNTYKYFLFPSSL